MDWCDRSVPNAIGRCSHGSPTKRVVRLPATYGICTCVHCLIVSLSRCHFVAQVVVVSNLLPTNLLPLSNDITHAPSSTPQISTHHSIPYLPLYLPLNPRPRVSPYCCEFVLDTVAFHDLVHVSLVVPTTFRREETRDEERRGREGDGITRWWPLVAALHSRRRGAGPQLSPSTLRRCALSTMAAAAAASAAVTPFAAELIATAVRCLLRGHAATSSWWWWTGGPGARRRE